MVPREEHTMEVVSINCPACGGIYGGRVTNRFIACEYCGTRFALGEKELQALGFRDVDGDGFDDEDYYEDDVLIDEDDGDSTPMDDFACDACEAFLDETDEKSEFKSSPKIERGLGLNSGDEIYLIHDDTLFKSGKNGFAITQSGFYCREMFDSNARFISWETFARGGRPEVSDSYISQDETSIVYFTGNEDVRHELCDLCVRLWQHAKNVC